jgi:hypothetical protein
MLSIDIPSGGRSKLTFAVLEKYSIPTPPNGFNSEINDHVTIQFDDEQQAIDYAQELDVYSYSINSSTMEYRIITDIIKAISDDEFVRAYIQN